jgi:hypothetical protein
MPDTDKAVAVCVKAVDLMRKFVGRALPEAGCSLGESDGYMLTCL